MSFGKTVLIAFAFVVATFLLPASPPLATTELPYAELKASGALEISRDIEVGKPFDIVFTFTPLDSFVPTRGKLDYARIQVRDSSVKLISGDTAWDGYLETGKEYTLRARYVLPQHSRAFVYGIVYAHQTLHKIVPVQFGSDKGVDYGFPAKAVFHDLIDLRTAEQRIERQPMVRLRVIDSATIIADTVWVEREAGLSRRPKSRMLETEPSSTTKNDCLGCHGQPVLPVVQKKPRIR